MRNYLLSLFAAAAVLAPAAPATAYRVASVDETFATGRCIVTRSRDAALDILRAVPNSADEADLSRLPPSVTRCARGITTADALQLRGAIVQELYRRDFGGAGLEPRRSTPLVNLNLPVQDSPAGDRTVELLRWADCVVRNDGEHVDRLLASTVGSRTEAAVIERMRSYMAACAPAGAEFSVRPGDLRALIAQSAYHSMYRYWTRQLAPVDTR